MVGLQRKLRNAESSRDCVVGQVKKVREGGGGGWLQVHTSLLVSAFASSSLPSAAFRITAIAFSRSSISSWRFINFIDLSRDDTARAGWPALCVVFVMTVYSAHSLRPH